MEKKFRAISLFSGAGGMDVGFGQQGFQVEFANDIDPVACSTYAANHQAQVVEGPLEESLCQLPDGEDIDVVFGGPPCQGFSVAGKMNPDDPRSRLVWSYFDAVERVMPKMFVCENVKALASLSRWKQVRLALFQMADRLGYHSTIVVLNASHFGVPQKRERMFMIGVRKDLVELRKIDLGAAIRGCLSFLEVAPPSVRDVVTKLGSAGSVGNQRVCNAVITFAKSPVLRPSPYAGMLFNGAGRPVKSDGFSCTLPASMGGNKTPIVDEGEIFEGLPSFVEEYHKNLYRGVRPRRGKVPSILRRMTIDECLAFQSFPPEYRLEGRQNAMYRQIGNAVPCLLAGAVANVVADVIKAGDVVLARGQERCLANSESFALVCETPDSVRERADRAAEVA